ncbi:MAG: prephenate dehydrogenase [Armatimonadota bacterium]|nr:prephenate dehydrogenase [Armatimonadota bacterium]
MVEKDTGSGFDVIAIIGVGLIGGSLGLAAKQLDLAKRVIGIGRNEQRLARAKTLGAVDDFTLHASEGVANADLVVVCMPVSYIVPTIREISPFLKSGAIVTDVGSTKSEIVLGAESVISNSAHFIGGHPMAGSEASGVEAAKADLFKDAAYVITPTNNTNLKAMRCLIDFARNLGSRTIVMTPEEHDESVAIMSHAPHVLAAAALRIAHEAELARPGDVFSLAAGSFRDLTRVAGSPPILWRDICMSNRKAVTSTLKRFEDTLAAMRKVIEKGNPTEIEALFEEAGSIRESQMENKT